MGSLTLFVVRKRKPKKTSKWKPSKKMQMLKVDKEDALDRAETAENSKKAFENQHVLNSLGDSAYAAIYIQTSRDLTHYCPICGHVGYHFPTHVTFLYP